MQQKHPSYILLFSFLFLFGCSKEESAPLPIVEPMQWREVSRDSISSGTAAGFPIGATAAETYRLAQQHLQAHTPNIQVVSNIYHKVEDVAGKIVLYNSLLFDEQKGTGTGVQLYFEDDHIASIYTNDGKKLESWPNNSSMRVHVGMSTDRVYPQLLALSSVSQYARKFQRISLFAKNTDKAFDPAMAQSPYWYFAQIEPDGQQKQIRLHFAEGLLASVVIGLYAPM